MDMAYNRIEHMIVQAPKRLKMHYGILNMNKQNYFLSDQNMNPLHLIEVPLISSHSNLEDNYEKGIISI